MEHRIPYLLLTASRVCYITIGLLCPNVYVIHEYADSDSTTLILIEIKVAAVLAGHEAIEVPGVGHACKSFVLYRDNSLLYRDEKTC